MARVVTTIRNGPNCAQMWAWVADNYGVVGLVIMGLAAAVLYLFRDRVYNTFITTEEQSRLEDKIDEQTDELSDKINEVESDLAARIDTVDENARERDKKLRKYAQNEYASSTELKSLREDMVENFRGLRKDMQDNFATFRTDIRSQLGSIQNQIGIVVNKLIDSN